jgi:nitroreductase
VLARFPNREAAERYAADDCYVKRGYRTASVREWEWSHRGNGHLGVFDVEPDDRFLTLLRSRVTARRFASRPVTIAAVRALLDAAHRAPSEFNLQPWRPVVCLTQESRAKLRACCLDQVQVTNAPVDVIVAASTRLFGSQAERVAEEFIAVGRWAPEERAAQTAFIRSCYPDDPAELRQHALKNAVLFGHQLLLAAASAGFAGFWLGGLEEAKVREAFSIPDHVVIAGVVGLGWPGPAEPRLPRLPLDQVVSWEEWNPAVEPSVPVPGA